MLNPCNSRGFLIMIYGFSGLAGFRNCGNRVDLAEDPEGSSARTLQSLAFHTQIKCSKSSNIPLNGDFKSR